MESQLDFDEPGCLARDETEAGARPCKADTFPKSRDDGLAEAHQRYLLQVNDRLETILGHMESRTGLSRRQKKRFRPERVALTRFIESNLERLAELGVVALAYPERVDYRLHEPTRVQITHLPEEDGRVVEMSRRGFMRNGLVFRTAHVTVLKYSPKPMDREKKEEWA